MNFLILVKTDKAKLISFFLKCNRLEMKLFYLYLQ